MCNEAEMGGTSSPILTHVTFHGNSAAMGGGICSINTNPEPSSAMQPLLRNVIFWGNTSGTNSPQIFNWVANPTFTSSIVQGSHGSGPGWDAALGIDGGGNLDADPKLGPLGSYGGPTQTFSLPADSPAVDAANGAACPDFDQRGVLRPQGAGCDIGAFELEQYQVSGSTGTGGVTLSYTNVTPRQTASGANGSYAFFVPTGWSGTVTVAKPGVTFVPPSRAYSLVHANQAAQDYAPTFHVSLPLLKR